MALEMIYPEPEPSPLEKMLIFIEKISESGGMGKIVMRTGNNRIGNCANFIDIFKNLYPWYFDVNQEDEKNNVEDFESLMKINNDNDNNLDKDNDINDIDNNIKEELNKNENINNNIINNDNLENIDEDNKN